MLACVTFSDRITSAHSTSSMSYICSLLLARPPPRLSIYRNSLLSFFPTHPSLLLLHYLSAVILLAVSFGARRLYGGRFSSAIILIHRVIRIPLQALDLFKWFFNARTLGPRPKAACDMGQPKNFGQNHMACDLWWLNWLKWYSNPTSGLQIGWTDLDDLFCILKSSISSPWTLNTGSTKWWTMNYHNRQYSHAGKYS